MDSSQRALQNNEKLFSKFKLALEFWLKSDFFFLPKNEKYSKEWTGVNIVIYQCIRLDKLYILMKSFFQISILFSNYWPKTEKH